MVAQICDFVGNPLQVFFVQIAEYRRSRLLARTVSRIAALRAPLIFAFSKGCDHGVSSRSHALTAVVLLSGSALTNSASCFFRIWSAAQDLPANSGDRNLTILARRRVGHRNRRSRGEASTRFWMGLMVSR